MGRSVAGLMALGLNHRTAPVAVRERVALDADGVLKHLKILCNEGICEEALLLSTCNRVELFAVPDAGGAGRVKDYLSSLRGPEGRSVAPHLFHLSGRDAVVHLFRVAASLDSMVLGEPQILGQVKEAIRLAEESSSLGGLLRPLTEQTIRIAKRVRTETELGRHRVGIGSTGVELARQIFGGLSGRRAMLVGVGDMGVEVARALQRAGVDELLVANRTFSRALEVAQEYLGTPISLDRVVEYLPRVDIVVTATASPTAVVTTRHVKRALKARKYRPLLFVDLAVPRNVDPMVDGLEEAFLYNIDDLVGIVSEGQEARQKASDGAGRLIEREADRFLGHLAEVDVGARLGELTGRMEAIRAQELSRSRRLRESLGEDQLAHLDAMTRALVKKILHQPMQRIRQAAREGDATRVDQLLAAWEEEE